MERSILGRTLGIAVLALASAGCGAKYMIKVAGPPVVVAPTATDAVLVVVSEETTMYGVMMMDEKKQFLGVSLVNSQFAVRVPAGEHTFVLWGLSSLDTHGISAHLAAGKTYFVYVHEQPPEMYLGLTPRSEEWAKLPKLLKVAEPYIPDHTKGQAYLDTNADSTNKHLAEITAIYSALPPNTPPTIGPDDGIPAGEDIATAVARSIPEKKPAHAPSVKKR